MSLDATTFRYRAARADGVLELGNVPAADRDAASSALAARGLFPLEIEAEREPISARAQVPLADVAEGLRVLSTLLDAGLPMTRALAALVDLAPASWAAALPRVTAAVREGVSLAAALGRAPIGIPPVLLGIIQAGEAGSGIAPAVRRAAELAESSAATRVAVRSALAYPALLAAAGTGAVALLVGLVLPRFAAILADLGQTLPPTTRLVLGTATFARVAALPALIGVGLAAIGWRAWTATDRGLVAWHIFLLDLPFVGTIRHSAATARFAAALAALLESGVPLSAALLHAARAAGDAALAARVRAARHAIVAGDGIARAMTAADALTPTAIRLIRAGEESGQLAPMLAHAANLERARADRLVRTAVRVLEPSLILAFGAVVALVAAALLQAVYSVRPNG